MGSYEIYRKFVSSSLTLERETLHVSDDTGRIALIDTRTTGSGSEPTQLLRYQYSNYLQSAILELDDVGAIISYEEYYPYGSTSFQSGRSGAEVSLKRYRYTGKERDEESGLYYHGARYYIPWLCRWYAPEPLNSLWYNSQNIDSQNIESQEDLNNALQAKYPDVSSYNYCANNPIKYIDPDGKDIKIHKSIKKSAYHSVINTIINLNTPGVNAIFGDFKDSKKNHIIFYYSSFSKMKLRENGTGMTERKNDKGTKSG